MKPETRRSRIIQRLEAEGWELARHGGEHDIYRHTARKLSVAVPRHRTLTPGVARSIARTAGWD